MGECRGNPKRTRIPQKPEQASENYWKSQVSTWSGPEDTYTEWMDQKPGHRTRTNTEIYGKRKSARGKQGGKKKKKRVLWGGIFNLRN